MRQLPSKALIKGAGDLASGTAHRLWQAGFDVVMLELPQPLVVRRSVSFASAVYEGSVSIEGVEARRCREIEEAEQIDDLLKKRIIPVFVDPEGKLIQIYQPDVLLDAILAKRNTGTSISDAPLVIGLGPGFIAGRDVHAVIETKRGHDLGRVIYDGSAIPNTGVPGNIAGFALERVLRAPAAGEFTTMKKIGDLVEKGEIVALVGDIPVKAAIGGVLRGLLYPGLKVGPGAKIGDIDPRGAEIAVHTISDKARSVGGGVLEAILHLSPSR